MEFSRQEYWSGLPFPSPRHLPNPGIKPMSSAWQVDSLPHGRKGGLIQVFITQQMKPKIFRFLQKKNQVKTTIAISPEFLYQLRHVSCLFASFLLAFIPLNWTGWIISLILLILFGKPRCCLLSTRGLKDLLKDGGSKTYQVLTEYQASYWSHICIISFNLE